MRIIPYLSGRIAMKKRGFLLLPLPFQGHINPMLQLANILFSKGFSITIIHTNFNSPSPLNFPHLTFISMSEDLIQSHISESDAVSLTQTLNTRCLEAFRCCLTKFLSENDDEICCLITDALWHSTQAIADSFKLPRLVLRTSSIFSFAAFGAFSLLVDKGNVPIKESQLESLFPELPHLKVEDIPVIKTTSDNPGGIWENIFTMMKETRISSGVIWNSFVELEESSLPFFTKQFPIPNFIIGPFHKYFPASSSSLLPQDQSSISWLDKQSPKSVLYVSFGSIAAVDEAEFMEIAWGLAKSKQPFVWVVRSDSVPGSPRLEALPDELLNMVRDRGHIVNWAPQQEVLAHPAVGGFWTHCGWNSTLESICEGVPMICLPFFGDQKVNARYITDVWKIGLRLENDLERNDIEKTIKRLMVDEERRKMEERVQLLKEKADICMKSNGSSFESLDNLVNYILSL